MIHETVEVIDVRGGRATVRFSRKTLCENCKAGSLCGAGKSEVVIDTQGYALVNGDSIEVAIEERATLLASVLVFCIPVLVFIAVLLFFRQQGELVSFSIALSTLAVYYALIMFSVRRMPKTFEVRVVRVVE